MPNEVPRQLIVKTLDETTAKEIEAAYEAFCASYWTNMAKERQNMSIEELAQHLQQRQKPEPPSKHDWVLEIFMQGWNLHKSKVQSLFS